jgi:hypothetical protein
MHIRGLHQVATRLSNGPEWTFVSEHIGHRCRDSTDLFPCRYEQRKPAILLFTLVDSFSSSGHCKLMSSMHHDHQTTNIADTPEPSEPVASQSYLSVVVPLELIYLLQLHPLSFRLAFTDPLDQSIQPCMGKTEP